MPERSLLRIGSVSAIVGSVLALVVNILHPRSATVESPEAFLRMILDSTIWVGDHVGILFAVLLITGGLTAIYRSIQGEPGAAWARLGFAGSLVSAAMLSLLMATDGITIRVLARAWANAPEAEKAVAFRVAHALLLVDFAVFSIWIIVFFGVTFILYGLAVVTSAVYPRWLGWVAALAGLGSALVGLNQAYRGASVLVTNVLFPIFSIIITLWVLVLGILLWRKTGAAA
ncbi:MAG: hypothetical protein HY726_08865 [Candidatus Rokubacteria bacterium]|nr:hypothetical protein [Candidatus Rokubacteria bacterium]